MSKAPGFTSDEVIRKTAERCRQRGIIIPTLAQLRNPFSIPDDIQRQLPAIGMGDVHPLNLFRINWKNDRHQGLFGGVNFLELPTSLTRVRARILGLTGKFFPTGAHKVGAAFGCLIPRLVQGQFDPLQHKAVWPSTGNFCRGGAFDCALLGCIAVAVLPERMSRERFDWLRAIGAEVIATPGCESNVKEIYDACRELRKNPIHVILNQFEDFGNPLFHYQVTGPALEEVFENHKGSQGRLAAFISATGSAGTIAAGDYLKNRHSHVKIVAAEALQCPTLLCNGFGDHRIEGIGDKHVPWIHNVRNSDAVAAIDDEDCMRLFRLFNEPCGQSCMESEGIGEETCRQLPLLGISGICNLLAAIKTAKYYGCDENDILLTVFTDSADLYRSRLEELTHQQGNYTRDQGIKDLAGPLFHQSIDYFKELTLGERKAIHHLKYFTWVEQQGRSHQELLMQWEPDYWREKLQEAVGPFEEGILSFNRECGASPKA